MIDHCKTIRFSETNRQEQVCVVPGGGYGIPACTEVDAPVNRMTDRCKNITLPQTSFAGGNKKWLPSTSVAEISCYTKQIK